MHLPPPNLPRFGGGERPPFSCKPIVPLTITIGQRLIFRPIIVPRPNPRGPPPPQALTTPRALLSVYSCQPIRAPFPPRERGWGERADTPVATLGAILCAVRIDFGLPSKINPYPAQPATGVLGQRPKRILPTFVRTKVGPRRVGVQIMPFIRPSPPRATANQPRRRAAQIMITKRLAPPKAISRYNLTGCGARVRDCDWPRKYPADRRAEAVSRPSAGRQNPAVGAGLGWALWGISRPSLSPA